MNEMYLKFLSRSENEVFARNVVAAFALPLNPTIAELSDVKTAVSEAGRGTTVRMSKRFGARAADDAR